VKLLRLLKAKKVVLPLPDFLPITNK
jgi:hypothetical protein